MPYQVSGTHASSTDPGTWATFEAVTDEWHRTHRTGYTGLGFVFAPEDPFCGIDLDDSLDEEGDAKAVGARNRRAVRRHLHGDFAERREV